MDITLKQSLFNLMKTYPQHYMSKRKDKYQFYNLEIIMVDTMEVEKKIEEAPSLLYKDKNRPILEYLKSKSISTGKLKRYFGYIGKRYTGAILHVIKYLKDDNDFLTKSHFIKLMRMVLIKNIESMVKTDPKDIKEEQEKMKRISDEIIKKAEAEEERKKAMDDLENLKNRRLRPVGRYITTNHT